MEPNRPYVRLVNAVFDFAYCRAFSTLHRRERVFYTALQNWARAAANAQIVIALTVRMRVQVHYYTLLKWWGGVPHAGHAARPATYHFD